jgi:hypothetical protein
MKQIYILLSYVFDNYLKTCKFLEVPSPNYYQSYKRYDSLLFTFYILVHIFDV